jgi:hypothetical protein
MNSSASLLRRNIRNPTGRLSELITGTTRNKVIKLKINGRCINNCRFCPFHNDTHLLEVRDIKKFFDTAGIKPFRSIVVNGGEPTIHPRFGEICTYLKEEFRDRMFLTLGTNLHPFSWSQGRYVNLRNTIYETFHAIEVGCDDEHRNIDALERFAPEIVEAGIKLDINVMADYCCDETKERILAVKDRYALKVSFSDLHHYFDSKPAINDMSRPCRRRAKGLLINCNGDVFFCFLQEMEKPLCNILTVTDEELLYYVFQHDPDPYRFCFCCTSYRPESFWHDIKVFKNRIGQKLPSDKRELQ